VERLGEHSAARPATTLLAIGRVSALGLLATAVFRLGRAAEAIRERGHVADADLLNLV
jgi:hypothetical protein